MECSKAKLRFKFDCIQCWAKEYSFPRECKEREIIGRIKEAQNNSCLEKRDLELVGKWKSPRSAGNIEKNKDPFVQEVTRFALSTSCGRAAIESLTILDGVGAPTASVVLHFFHVDSFPILDFRALWSVSLNEGREYKYDYMDWLVYVDFCRDQANKAGVCKRVLDRALWQYSKSEQEKRQRKNTNQSQLCELPSSKCLRKNR